MQGVADTIVRAYSQMCVCLQYHLRVEGDAQRNAELSCTVCSDNIQTGTGVAYCSK